MYNYKRGVGVKCFLLLVFNAFSLILPAQTPMFTTGIDLVGSDQFLLANKGTKSVTIIDKAGRLVKEWVFDEPVTGQCLSKGTAYVTSSYGRGWLSAINLGTGKVIYKTETGMGARSPIINKDGTRIYVFNQFKTTVSELDSKSGKVLRQIKVLREPVAGALTPDGKYLFVNNFLPEQQANVDIVAAQVSVIDLSKFEVVKNIRLDNGSNALHGICVSLDGKYVFVTHNLGRDRKSVV